MTGSLASFNHTVYTLYNALQAALRDQPSRRADVEILEIDGVANVMRERVRQGPSFLVISFVFEFLILQLCLLSARESCRVRPKLHARIGCR